MSEIVFINEINQLKNILSNADMIITDSTVKSLYGELLKDAYDFPAGEKSKSFDTLMRILKEMHVRGIRRSDTVYAVGGGVVCDIVGLAAALYMRGIKSVNIPTSLLGIVDASVGGKTAVNFDGVKNLVGAFKNPDVVYSCAEFLNTLPFRERVCGVGEIIKTCLLTVDSFDLLKNNIGVLKDFCDGNNCDNSAMSLLISACIEIKSEVVRRDPHETGLRKILNVGHTVGHALESVNNYEKSHGEYVIMGMMTELCMLREYVDGEFLCEVVSILKTFTSSPKTTVNAVLKAASSDKKNDDCGISIMLPVRAGDIANIALSCDEFKTRYDAAVKELRSI